MIWLAYYSLNESGTEQVDSKSGQATRLPRDARNEQERMEGSQAGAREAGNEKENRGKGRRNEGLVEVRTRGSAER